MKKCKKKRERQKEKDQFFLSNGGLGDWWSISFDLFRLHWRFSQLWHIQRKTNFYANHYKTQKYIIHKERLIWTNFSFLEG